MKSIEAGGGRGEGGQGALDVPQLNYEQTEQQYGAKMVGGGW